MRYLAVIQVQDGVGGLEGGPLSSIQSLMWELVRELQRALPQILAAVIVITVMIIVTKYINKFVRVVLRRTGVEEAYKRLSPEPPRVPLSDLVVVIIDVGVVLLTAALILRPFATYDPELVAIVLDTAWRFGGLIVIMLIFMTGLDVISRSIHLERKTESMLYFVMLFLGLALMVDLTNLSPSIKAALAQGMAVGIGISIGVFIVWLFFGEYIERATAARERCLCKGE